MDDMIMFFKKRKLFFNHNKTIKISFLNIYEVIILCVLVILNGYLFFHQKHYFFDFLFFTILFSFPYLFYKYLLYCHDKLKIIVKKCEDIAWNLLQNNKEKEISLLIEQLINKNNIKHLLSLDFEKLKREVIQHSLKIYSYIEGKEKLETLIFMANREPNDWNILSFLIYLNDLNLHQENLKNKELIQQFEDKKDILKKFNHSFKPKRYNHFKKVNTFTFFNKF